MPSREDPRRGAAPQEAAGGEDPAESLRRGGGERSGGAPGAGVRAGLQQRVGAALRRSLSVSAQCC